MNIVFFLADLYGGGAEKSTLMIINHLSQKYDVTLILVRKSGKFLKDIDQRVTLIILESKSVYKSFISLYKALRVLHPDILISSLDTANLLATVVSKILGIKNITIVHGVISFKYSNKKVMKFLIKGLRYSTLTVAVSKAVQSDLKKYSITSKVLYNPISIGNSYSKKEKIVLSVGRLEKVKNYKLLIDAFHLLNLADYSLVILGEGSLKDELQNYINSKNISNVFLLGFMNPNKFYEKATLFVSSSLSESFGNVIVEALSYGINIVATQTEGAEEILAYGKYGTLVSMNDKIALASAIMKRIKNPIDKDILKTRAETFGTIRTLQKYEEMIEEIVYVNNN